MEKEWDGYLERFEGQRTKRKGVYWALGEYRKLQWRVIDTGGTAKEQEREARETQAMEREEKRMRNLLIYCHTRDATLRRLRQRVS